MHASSLLKDFKIRNIRISPTKLMKIYILMWSSFSSSFHFSFRKCFLSPDHCRLLIHNFCILWWESPAVCFHGVCWDLVCLSAVDRLLGLLNRSPSPRTCLPLCRVWSLRVCAHACASFFCLPDVCLALITPDCCIRYGFIISLGNLPCRIRWPCSLFWKMAQQLVAARSSSSPPGRGCVRGSLGGTGGAQSHPVLSFLWCQQAKWGGSRGLGVWVHFMLSEKAPPILWRLGLEKEGMPLEAGVSGAGETAGTWGRGLGSKQGPFVDVPNTLSLVFTEAGSLGYLVQYLVHVPNIWSVLKIFLEQINRNMEFIMLKSFYLKTVDYTRNVD